MKTQAIDTTTKKIKIFQIDFAYDDKHIAEKLDISPQTLSRRFKMNIWLFDEVRAIKNMFKDHNVKF